MKELRIKTESLAKRCEICHKIDCFDAKTNYCSRCVGVNSYKEKKENRVIRNQLQISQKWCHCENHPGHLLLLVALLIGMFSVTLKTPIILIALLFFIFVLYVYFVNKTTIEATKEELLIKYGPIPIWFTNSIKLDDIKGFYLSKNYCGFYIVKVIVGNRNKVIAGNKNEVKILLKHLSLEKAILIERHLTQWFNFSIFK